jgi:hypothetical protein
VEYCMLGHHEVRDAGTHSLHIIKAQDTGGSLREWLCGYADAKQCTPTGSEPWGVAMLVQ